MFWYWTQSWIWGKKCCFINRGWYYPQFLTLKHYFSGLRRCIPRPHGLSFLPPTSNLLLWLCLPFWNICSNIYCIPSSYFASDLTCCLKSFASMISHFSSDGLISEKMMRKFLQINSQKYGRQTANFHKGLPIWANPSSEGELACTENTLLFPRMTLNICRCFKWGFSGGEIKSHPVKIGGNR